MDFCAVDCVFCAGNKCEKRNVYTNGEVQDSPALSARCHGAFVEQRERSRLQQQNEWHCRTIVTDIHALYAYV